MKKLTLAATTAAILAGTTGLLSAEVVLRLVPYHTDAHTENFNPYNYSHPSGFVQDFAYEPLWIYNIMHPDNDYPALATSFDVAEDMMSVTYHLREGVVWSDGEPFTADDLIFTFNYDKAHPDFPIGFDHYTAETDSGSIVSVEKLDDYTVRFNLHKPDALAHLNIGIAFPLPEHIWASVEDPKNFANETIVATGPWTNVEAFSRSSWKLCRNETYRENDTNQIDCLQFPQLSGNEQVMAAMTNGDLDWAGDGMTDPEITYAAKSEYNQYWLPADGNTNLLLNTTKAPFDNLEFRKAFSMAINRQPILDIATFGLTTASRYPIGTGEFYSAWYNEAEMAPYEYLMEFDAERAMATLDAAGIVDQDGDGWRDNPDGSPIDFKISVPAGWTDWVNTVQLVSENLQDIGVNGNMHAMEEGAWFDNFATGDFDVYIMWVETSTTPWWTYYAMFDPKAMVPGQIREQAMHQMRIPEIEASLAAIASTRDVDEQRLEIQKIHIQVAENLPMISLFANPSWYQYSTRNFTGWSNEDNAYVRPMMHPGIHERVKHALSLTPVER